MKTTTRDRIAERCTNLMVAVSRAMPPAIYLLVGVNTVLLAAFYAIVDYKAGGIDADSGFVFTFGTLILIVFCWERRYHRPFRVLLVATAALFAITMVLRCVGSFVESFDPRTFSYESIANGIILVLGIILIGNYLKLRSCSSRRLC